MKAHHLRNAVLEDLRLLTNYEMDSRNRLCLLLVGLTELRRRLSMAVHESLAQRVVVRYHLAGLAREELSEYLAHRLRLAGCELPLFEPPAVEALFQATQGMPRKINRLAHYALTSAALDQAQVRHHRTCADRPGGNPPMNPKSFQFLNPPVLSDENAAAILGFLYDLTSAFENHYGAHCAVITTRSPPVTPSSTRTNNPFLSNPACG